MNFTVPDNMSEMPSGHEGFNFDDVEKCPVFKINKKLKKDPNFDSEDELSSDGEEQDDQPKGGCPVMSNTRKKNPGLGIPESGHNIPYISPMAHLLNGQGIYDLKDGCKSDEWERYPIYLKHTVFHIGEEIETARELEIGHRFFIQDKLRERGNERFHKGHYTMALKHYGLALSTIKWQDCKVDMEANPYDRSKLVADQKKIGKSKDIKKLIKNNFTKFKIESEEELETKIVTENTKNFDKNDPIYSKYARLLLTTFHDKNVVLYNGEECTEKSGIETRDSLQFGIYLNMAACYMKLKHFELATQILNDCRELQGDNSQVLYRLALARACNLSSSLEELHLAKEEISRANVLKDKEQIFENEEYILEILNLLNYKEAYEELTQFIEKRIQERKDYEREKITKVVSKCKELQRTEQRMVRNNKVPEGRTLAPKSVNIFNDGNFEPTIMNGMLFKYGKVIEFHQMNKESLIVKQGYKEIGNYMETYHNFFHFWNMDNLSPYQNEIYQEILKKFNIGSLTQKKFIQVARDNAREILESKRFNLELYSYTMDDYMKIKTKELVEERDLDIQYNLAKKGGNDTLVNVAIFGMVLFTGYVFAYGSPFMTLMS